MVPKVVIAVSHPIQHFCPLYAFLSRDSRIDLTVVFGVTTGSASYFDEKFGQVVNLEAGQLLGMFPNLFISQSSDLSKELSVTRKVIWRHLNNLNPMVVIVYGVSRKTSRWAWLWSRAKRRKVIYIADSEDRGRQGLSVFRKAAQTIVLATMSRIFVVGDANRKYYRARLVQGSRMRNMPFPIDRSRYDAALKARFETRLRARARLGLNDEVVVMSCGKLEARKSHGDIIGAVSKMRDPKPVVVLAGSGDLLKELLALAKELRVRLLATGFVPPSELPELYLASDIYVHPSSYDPHPLTVSEAVYCGLPAVVSDRIGSWGPSDDVQPGRNGFVFRHGDTKQLATQLETLSHDTVLRTRMSVASAELASRRQYLAYEGFADALVGIAKDC